MIYLSATSIKDFLTCSQRYYYRIHYPEESVSNDDMQVGTSIHYLLEKYALDENFMDYAVAESDKFSSATAQEKLMTCAKGYYYYYKNVLQDVLTENDSVEKSFKLEFAKDVYIVGKMDRITVNGTVIDWKTSKTAPKSINTDIQFIIYNWAYKKLYSKSPARVFYCNLYKEDSYPIPLKITESYQTLFDEIIPGIVKQIRANNFYKSGIYTNSCYMCSFKNLCLGEKNELSS